jgi:hypothetical protein
MQGQIEREVQIDHATKLISLLHPTPTAQSLIEITGLAPRTRPVKRYFMDVAPAVEFALEFNDQGYSVFTNTNPRDKMSGFEEDVPFVSALALDLQPERVRIEGVEAALAHAGLLPSAVGVSGYGAHMYLLIEPAERTAAKLVWERLCKWTLSDPIHSVNRIMRLAGSRNWKKNPPAWCYLTAINPERRYDLDYVVKRLDAVGAPPARSPKVGFEVPADAPADWFLMCQRIKDQPGGEGVIDIIETGERNAYSEKQLTRSEADWVVVCALVRSGATDEFIQWVYEKKPVGNMKFREAGPRYLTRTIEAARRATAEKIQRTGGHASDAYRSSSGSSRDEARARRYQ